jgi:hypothetical protein
MTADDNLEVDPAGSSSLLHEEIPTSIRHAPYTNHHFCIIGACSIYEGMLIAGLMDFI